MKTKKEIRKQIAYYEAEIKKYDAPELTSLLKDRIKMLKWVLGEDNEVFVG